MADIVIEKGIPIPTIRTDGKKRLATMRKMKVGDSFLAPKADRFVLNNCFMRLKPMKFSVRLQDGGQIRVWRIV